MRVLSIGNMYPPHRQGGYELAWESSDEHLRARGNQVRTLTTDHVEPGVSEPDRGDVHRELRWYWRDQRVARAQRSWRLSYQPLSDSWRVSLGGLAQTHGTLAEAVAALSGAARWKIADHSQIEPDERYYVEFSYKLDTTQLPRPMQFGIGGQADWSLGVERVLKVE